GRSPGFFNGKPLILDLAGVTLDKAEITKLIADLTTRTIRILGIEGVAASALDDTLPPLLTGGRTLGAVEVAEAVSPAPGAADAAKSGQAEPANGTAPQPSQVGKVPSLLIESPIRSGQAVINPDGDVIILGSVASGAEVIAAGSIHVYGTLRGRALAGA